MKKKKKIPQIKKRITFLNQNTYFESNSVLGKLHPIEMTETKKSYEISVVRTILILQLSCS